jgi:hypothetical protein
MPNMKCKGCGVSEGNPHLMQCPVFMAKLPKIPVPRVVPNAVASIGHNGGPAIDDIKEKNSAERKGEPIHSGVLRYFPDALAAVSRVSKAGNDKHNPGEPLHWSRGKSNDHLDCAARHIITPGEIDPDSGETHIAHAAWRILAALQLSEEKRLSAKGIRTFSGVSDNG